MPPNLQYFQQLFFIHFILRWPFLPNNFFTVKIVYMLMKKASYSSSESENFKKSIPSSHFWYLKKTFIIFFVLQNTLWRKIGAPQKIYFYVGFGRICFILQDVWCYSNEIAGVQYPALVGFPNFLAKYGLREQNLFQSRQKYST